MRIEVGSGGKAGGSALMAVLRCSGARKLLVCCVYVGWGFRPGR